MPKNPEIPLHLCQVLEEEFENLHEPLDDGRGEEVAVKDSEGRPVSAVVKSDWDFHEGHVSPELAKRLHNALEQWGQAREDGEPGGAEKEVATYLALSDDELRAALQAARKNDDGAVAVPEELLTRVLSAALDDDRLFTWERFGRLTTLRDETRALAELAWENGGAVFADKDGKAGDRARFRRLLLEDAFPDEIRRAYDLRVSRVIRRVHKLPTGRSAICLSGGGIRSGTFALGVIQSLAGLGLLDKFDYLSTVSGGGYIGGWLSAWIHRHPKGLRGVIADLEAGALASKIEPEPEPLRHLRDYSSFTTPRTGLLSADSWTFIVIYIRNLLLNWVVLIPLLASVLMVPRVADAVILATPGWGLLARLLVLGGIGILLLKPDRNTLWTLIAVGVPSMLVILAGRRGWLPLDAPLVALVEGTLLAAGVLLSAYTLAYMRLNRPSNSGAIRPGSFWDRHRDQSSFIWLCLLPLVISAVLLTTFWAWFRHTAGGADIEGVRLLGRQMSKFEGFLLYGALVGFTGWLLYIALAGASWLGGRREVRQMYAQGKLVTGVFKNMGRELIVTLLASVIGSVLLYVAATKIPLFYDPVVEPFARRPLYLTSVVLRPYTEWGRAEVYTCLAFPTYLLIFFLGLTLFVGFTSRRSEKSPRESREPEAASGAIRKLWRWLMSPFDRTYVLDEDREWLARASAWVVIVMAGWLFFGGLVIFGPLLFLALGNWLAGVGGVSGLLTLLGGRSTLTPGGPKQDAKRGRLETLGINLLVVAAFVFFACIVIAVSLLSGTLVVWLADTYFTPSFASLMGMSAPYFAELTRLYPFESAEGVFTTAHFPSWLYLLLLALALHLFGRLGSQVINLNKFSLHAGYRDRIIRAFLGASRLKNERKENPFTGFDPRDDLHMEELRPWQLRESDFKEPHGLAAFVAALAGRPGGAPAAKGARGDAGEGARRAAADYLRAEIERMGGESRNYFRDPPESVNTNPSFRSALFADLSRILQVKALDKAPEFGPYLEEAHKNYRELAPSRGGTNHRVLLNRLLLLRTFPDSLKYPPRLYSLMHVVNMTLNLVGGKRLAWQQRRAESFTSTPLHSGSLFVGYRPTRDYGGKNGIRLGTAVATSGAAASSNMGYFTPSPFVTLVLTFFNARLGWWLGNPGARGWDTYFRSHPQNALSPILDEAFGLTDDENPYVLLSDGGHFENLGLYEMVLRRCRNIVVVDGSADPEGNYDDLGGAVRKIRIDFGIAIEFEPPFLIYSREESKEQGKGAYFAVGDIHYEEVDDPRGEYTRIDPATGKRVSGLTGKLVYVKPAVYGDEPRDIYNYARSHEDFPHESTADQFFDEPQFESHRMLGYYIIEQLCDEAKRVTPSGGISPCETGELRRFVEWVDSRAAELRRAAGQQQKGTKSRRPS